jgi:hypothetical protein
MSLDGNSFTKAYEAWLKSESPIERAELARILETNLRQSWEIGDTDTRIMIIDFVHLTKSHNFDLILEAMREEDIGLASMAVTTIALLVWEGFHFERERIRRELDSFATRNPDWRNVCESILRRVQ